MKTARAIYMTHCSFIHSNINFNVQHGKKMFMYICFVLDLNLIAGRCRGQWYPITGTYTASDGAGGYLYVELLACHMHEVMQTMQYDIVPLRCHKAALPDWLRASP